MLRCQTDCSSLFLGANPDGSGATDQREWIVPDNFRRPSEVQRDGIVRIGTPSSPCEALEVLVRLRWAEGDTSETMQPQRRESRVTGHVCARTEKNTNEIS